MDGGGSRGRERWSRLVFLVWLIFAIALYFGMRRGPHTQARATEYWVFVGLALLLAAIGAGLLRVDQPGRSLTWRVLTAPWLWFQRLSPRQRRRSREHVAPMVRDSELYRASVAWRDSPSQIRGAMGLPPTHDESQWH